jgi:hypothetical protein
LGDAGLPFGGAGLVDAGAFAVDGYGDGHVDDFELVDGFHAEVGKGQDFAALDGFGDEVGGSADGDEVDGFELADGVDGDGAAFGFADHAEQAGLGEHLAGELVHARGGGGAGGADGFIAHGFNGADVVDEPALEVDGELFAAGEHVGEALVGGVAAGEELAREQDDFAGLPGLGVFMGDGVEIDAAGILRRVFKLGPEGERRRGDRDWTGAVEVDVEVAGGGAVGDHGDGQVGGVGGELHDLDVEDGGEAAETLGADAELVDLGVELDAEGFHLRLRAAVDEFAHVDGVHEGLLGHDHGFFGGASDADAEHSGVLRTQSTMESDGLSMANLDFASEPPPFEATVMSKPDPATSSTTTMAGVLSPVLRRVKAGSARMLGRRTLSELRQASRTPSSIICCMDIMPKVAEGAH